MNNAASENKEKHFSSGEKNISIVASEKTQTEKINVVDSPDSPLPSSPSTDRHPRALHSTEFLASLIPCPACSSNLFWESLYFDGQVRCWKCEPPPGIEFVGRRIEKRTVRVSDERGGDGEAEAVAWEQVELAGGKPVVRRPTAPGSATASKPTLPALGDVGGEGVVGDVTGGQVAGIDRTDSSDSIDPADLDANARYDRFVEIRGIDGRALAITGWALRGWDNPHSPNFNLRLVQAAGMGWERADLAIDDWQEELRAEMFGGDDTVAIPSPATTRGAM